MIERIIIIDNVDPVSFYGINNCNMQLIRNLFPKLRMAARGQIIKVIGDPEETANFEKKIKELEAYCAQYNKLTEDVILDIVKGTGAKEVKNRQRHNIRHQRQAHIGTLGQPATARKLRNRQRPHLCTRSGRYRQNICCHRSCSACA